MTQKTQSLVDRFIINADQGIRTLTQGVTRANRPSPAQDQADCALDNERRKHIAGLMRVNHTGEVCAQALYQGQAITAKESQVRESMTESADEEQDHLVWCEERLRELDSQTSKLNPLFYGMSFSLGALAGLIGDKVSLGFVAETEHQVCKHLSSHLEQLPEKDRKTRLILEQMLVDEEQHGAKAKDAGAADFPQAVRAAMTLMSKVMTKTTYRF